MCVRSCAVLLLVVLSLSDRIRAQICPGALQYDQCSSNIACGCLPLSSKFNVAICAYLDLICSELNACAADNKTCFESGHVCVKHTRCHSRPLCYPLNMGTQVVCPPMPQTTTRPPMPDDGICASATWNKNGVTVAGGNGYGSKLNQLDHPYGLYIDDDSAIYIADAYNSRIVKWAPGASTGQVVVGWDGTGDRPDEIDYATSVAFDKNGTMFVCDSTKNRVKRWFKNDGRGQTILSNISCFGLAVDNEGSLYITDHYRVMKWPGDQVVAGNNGEGSALNQLAYPFHLFVDRNRSVFVPDASNYRVVKWAAGAKEGIVVAGDNGQGDDANQTNWPTSAITDQMGTIYVAEWGGNRITRWFKGSKSGSVILGGERGNGASQLAFPTGLVFDRQGNLYTADIDNNRVQMFKIDKSSCGAIAT